MWVI
jgi:hypothetical protein